ncbi:MAG TPA: hypothetical protein PKD27_14930, partial [Tepidiformaceae bacterium]|nr:hypothetical protein [Tepidiformaceae bacterium]
MLAVLAALVLLGLDASGPERATAQTGGQGVFSLDKTEYETVEGQAVLVTVRRTDGGILTQGVDVQLALSPGGHSGSGTGFDWPPSDEVKLVSFPAGANLTQQSVYIQTLNQNQYNSRSIHVTIRSISNGGLMGPIWTSPIHLDGTNQPQVLSISPKAADGGAIVTITGRNFVTGSSIANSVTFLPRNGGVPPAGTLVDSFLEPPTPSTLRFFVPSPGLN